MEYLSSIKQADHRLADWAVGRLEKVGVLGVKPAFDPPTDPDDSQLAVSLYLLELVDDPRRHNTGRPKLQPSLRYLVTTHAGDPTFAHDLLGVLFYAALDHPEYEVELEPVDTHLWSAFGIKPRPAFVLRVPIPHEWKPAELPLVSQGIAAEMRELVTLYGCVLGPGDTPLANARVELDRAAVTAPNGRFTLPGVAAAPAVKSVLVTARGRQRRYAVTATGSEAAPVLFRLDIGVTLFGRVVGPGGAAVAKAQVSFVAPDVPGTAGDTAAYAQPLFAEEETRPKPPVATDAEGRFTLPDIPAAPAVSQFVVVSGGRRQAFTQKETGDAAKPVLFTFDPVS